MFNRFKASGRQAMDAAREEAITFGHNYLGTEHLLLGVLNTEPGGELLERLGLTLEDARVRVVEIVGRAEGPEQVTTARPSTPRTMDVLVLAWQEARQENDIG